MFPVVLFIQHYMLLGLWMLSESVAIQIKATEQYITACRSVYYAVQGGCNLHLWVKS